ncbi:MAG: acetyl-CoA C-acyltransferase, partial [Holophagae bacterium]|nr:acetyl-CoA C-acyltransferase [Holophagae bacterium]
MRDAVIVAAKRTPIGRGRKGVLAKARPDDLLEKAITGCLEQTGEFDHKQIEDALIGCAFPEGEQGMNVGRLACLMAGLPVDVPAATINRFCGSAMTGLHSAAHAIMSGAGDIFIAGGCESMSQVPMIGNKFSPNPRFIETDIPNAYVPMGETAEKVIDRYDDKYDLSREALDRFGYNSHMKAISAQ